MNRAVAVVISLMAAMPCAAKPGGPTSQEVKAEVAAILAQPLYDFEEKRRYALNLNWLLDLIMAPLRYLYDLLDSMPPVVSWVIIYVLIAILIALIGHIVYTFYRVLRRSDERVVSLHTERRPSPEQLVVKSGQLAAAGNYVDASRLLYRAALTLLEDRRGGRVHHGLTNTEYLRTFRTPWVIDSLGVFVELINWKWYRDRAFNVRDYQACRRAYDTLLLRLNKEGPPQQ